MCFPPRSAVDLEHPLRQSPRYTREHVGSIVTAEALGSRGGRPGAPNGGHSGLYVAFTSLSLVCAPGERFVWVTLLNTAIGYSCSHFSPPKKLFKIYFLNSLGCVCFGMRPIKLHGVRRIRSHETLLEATRNPPRASAL